MPTCHICSQPAGPSGTVLSSIVTATAGPSFSRTLCFNCSLHLLDLLDGCATAHAAGHPDVLSEAADLVASANADDAPPEDDEDDEEDDEDDDNSSDLDMLDSTRKRFLNDPHTLDRDFDNDL